MSRPLPPVQIGDFSAPVIPDVLDEHLEELAFLSIQRRKLLFSADVPYTGIQEHDDRITAHWEGLLLAPDASVQIAEARFDAFDTWEIYAAARVWLEMGNPDGARVLECLEATDEEALAAWREALRRIPTTLVRDIVPARIDSTSLREDVAATLTYAKAWHGLLSDEDVAHVAFSSSAVLRRTAARLIGWGATSPSALGVLQQLLSDPELDVRRAAAWSEVMFDPDAAVNRVRSDVAAGQPDFFSVRVLGLLGSPSDGSLLVPLIGSEPIGFAAIAALGDLGSPRYINMLVDLLEHDLDAICLAAVEAISTVLGGLPQQEGDIGFETETDSKAHDVEMIHSAWGESEEQYRDSACWIHGHPFPWKGPDEEEPMGLLWRRCITSPVPGFGWLRREVPDGFFRDTMSTEALPGE